MKCPICGKQTLPGAKLCSPCRAALKRAKDDSVWELPASQRPGEATQPTRDAPWVLGAPRLAAWQVWAIAGATLAVCLGVGLQLARSGERPVAPMVATTAPAARPIVAEPAAAPLQGAIPASTQAPLPDRPAAPIVAAADPAVIQPPRQGDHAAPLRPKTPKSSVEPAVAPPPAVEPAAVAITPPAATVELPARPVDPWQRMNDALARCRAQDLFGRLGCEYRVRTSYCEGHWGEVPQCPAAATNDHGQ